MASAWIKLNWQWLVWQVGVPLGGPVILSWLTILAWETGNPNFTPQWSIVLDVSPWALTFYGLTLVGASLNSLWPRIPSNAVIGGGLIASALAMAIYTAFMIIWRHDSGFAPGLGVYLMTGAMLFFAVFFSYRASANQKDI